MFFTILYQILYLFFRMLIIYSVINIFIKLKQQLDVKATT